DTGSPCMAFRGRGVLCSAEREGTMSTVEQSPAPYAQGRVYHDADAHVVETPGWLLPYADPKVRDLLPRSFVAAVAPGEEEHIERSRARHLERGERPRA